MIYVCVPAHNEATTIGVLLWKVRKVLGEFRRDYRIVVHDDASTDETREVLARYRRALPLTILTSDSQVGYGRSVEALLRHTVDHSSYPKRDCAVVLQGDFTENPTDLIGLVKVLEGGADIVAGTVEDEEEEAIPTGVRRVRRFARMVPGGAVAKAPVSDPMSGMRAYRVIVLKKAVRAIPDDAALLTSDGWAANVELLSRLAPHARRIEESPLALRYDLQTRDSRFQAWKTFLALLRLRASLWAPLAEEAS